jgi:aldehyde dehydrogenase (NAD(P)+)
MDTSPIDAALEVLDENKARWARLPVATKIHILDGIRTRVGTVAHAWVEAAAEAKQIPPGSQLVGEEWTSGPYALAASAAALADTLRRIEGGTRVLEGYPIRTLANGQVAVTVFPANFEDRLFLSAHTAEVWMQPGVEEADLERSAASFYRKTDPEGFVSLVLGAGNIASIAPLDALTELFNYGAVTAVKLNPINVYLGPFLKEIFGELIEGGFIRFVYGGTDEGIYLTRHRIVEHVHVTGAGRTHDAIVYGVGVEGERRKADDEPIISVPVTAELGGVGPTIVVGGRWSDADLRYQAEHIVSQKLHNHGFNCIACQVLVLPDEWEQADDLLDAMRGVVSEVGDRGAYYPGVAERHAQAVASHGSAEVLTNGAGPVTFITDLDPAMNEDVCFTTEFFGAVLGVVRLPGADTAAYLDNAVAFANDTLDGNLGANLIIHPATAKRDPDALEQAIGNLRYGTIAVNSWVGVAFAINRATWGAFPGNRRNDIGSGTGVVHNSLMLERTERSVVRGAFAPFPRTLRQGAIHVEPTPPFFVTNRQAAHLGELLTESVVDGSRRHLPAIVATAMRG